MLERLRRGAARRHRAGAVPRGARGAAARAARRSRWHELTRDVLGTPPRPARAARACSPRSTTRLSPATTSWPSPTSASASRRPRSRVASFLAYAIANNVGFAMLSGASVRYRFYTRWGVTAEELSRIVFSYLVTFWLGLLALGGLSLAREPAAGAAVTCRGVSLAPASAGCSIAVSVGYVVGRPRAPDAAPRFGGFELPLPSPAHRARAAARLGRRLGAGRRGALRAAAAEPACRSWRSSARSSLAHLLGAGQPRARRRRRVRGADGAAAEAVPGLGDAAAGAGRLPRRLLPAAARRRARRARRRRDCGSAARRRRGSARCSAR